MQLQEALDSFLIQQQANGRSRHTIQQYSRYVRLLGRWLADVGHSGEIAEIGHQDVARFLCAPAATRRPDGGQKKPTSLNALRTSMRMFFAWAADVELVSRNPAGRLRRARCGSPPPRALHDDERERLQVELGNLTGPVGLRDRMLVELLLGAGLRIGAAIGLDLDDVDLPHRELQLRTGKNDRPTVVVLPSGITDKLAAFLGDRTAGPVFLAGSKRISIRQAQRRIASIFHRARIGRLASAHTLRHTFATSLLSKTGNLRVVQAALGHCSIASTVVYTSVDRSAVQAALGA